MIWWLIVQHCQGILDALGGIRQLLQVLRDLPRHDLEVHVQPDQCAH